MASDTSVKNMKETIETILNYVREGDLAAASSLLSPDDFVDAGDDICEAVSEITSLLGEEKVDKSVEALKGLLERVIEREISRIANAREMANAIIAFKEDSLEVKTLIAKRAEEMGYTELLPEGWLDDPKSKNTIEMGVKVTGMQGLQEAVQAAREALVNAVTGCAHGECGYEQVAPVTEGYRGGELIHETNGGFIESLGDAGNVYKVTLIRAGVSKNRNYWSPDVLKGHARMFEGTKAFADHPSASEAKDRPERSIRDVIGWYEGVRWVSDNLGGGRITANLHLLPGVIAENVRAAHAMGRPDLFQLSVNVSGQRRPRLLNGVMVRAIENISFVHSTDVVTEASAGGSIDNIAASERPTEEVKHLMALDNLSPEELEALLKENPDLREAASKILSEGEEPSEEPTVDDPPAEEPRESEQPGGDDFDTKLTEALTPMQDEVRKMREERALERCELTLERSLNASGLPDNLKDVIRTRFAGKIFEASDLEDEIKAAKELVEAAQANSVPSSVPWLVPGDSVESTKDKWTLAMDGLIKGEPQKDKDGNVVKPFLNLRHAYQEIAGKNSFQQTGYEILAEAAGYDSGMYNENVGRFQETPASTTMVTGDFPLILGDSITRQALAEYRFPRLQDWRRVSRVASVSDLRTQLREIVGEFQLTEDVSENTAYPDLSANPLPEQEAFYTAKKRGGEASLTLEAVINDDLGKLRNIPVKLGRAAAGRIYMNVFNLLMLNPREDTFLTGGSTTRGAFASANQRAPGNLIGDDGTGGFVGNVNSSLIVPNDANLSDAKRVFHLQQAADTAISGRDSLSYILAEPRNLLFAPTNEAIVTKLLRGSTYYQKDMTNAADYAEPDVNIHQGTLSPLMITYWEQAANLTTNFAGTLSPKNLWIITADPNEIPIIEVGFLNGREEPEIFTARNELTPDMFDLDVIKWKVRHFWDAGLLDTRGFVAAHVKRTG